MDWTDEAQKVADALEDDGADVVIVVTDKMGQNLRTEAQGEDKVRYPGNALISDFTIREIDGTNIMVGDKKLMVSATGLPRLDQEENVHVEFDDFIWNLVAANPLMPGGTPILYKLQVRN